MFRSIPRPTSARRPPLGVDRLPDRINPVVTDMTAMSMFFPTHDGPTTLWINFDGCAGLGGSDSKPGHTVAPFTGSAADKADILYRVSEEFAPFNVTVKQAYGFGNYQDSDGATTVFVGDDRYFDQALTFPNGFTWGYLNQPGGVTPHIFSDTPYKDKPDHAPNSDPYDIAFADPVFQSGYGLPFQNQSNDLTADAIAHEAGHTFGLVHVFGGSATDIMSYNSSNLAFTNQGLPITTVNQDPKTNTTPSKSNLQPVFTDPTDGVQANITTQNSYTYLGSMLGWRPPHAPRVSHLEAVDAAYSNFSADYETSFTRDVNLGAGDYRVYHIVPGESLTAVDIKVDRAAGQISPIVLIYRPTGAVEFYDSHLVGGTWEVQARVAADSGRPFDLVIGGAGGSEGGRLHVEVSRPLGSYGTSILGATTATTGSLGSYIFGTNPYLSATVGTVGPIIASTGSLGTFGSGSPTLDPLVDEVVAYTPPPIDKIEMTSPMPVDAIPDSDPVDADPAPIDPAATDEPVVDGPAPADEPAPVDEPVATDESPGAVPVDDPTTAAPVPADAIPADEPPVADETASADLMTEDVEPAVDAPAAVDEVTADEPAPADSDVMVTEDAAFAEPTTEDDAPAPADSDLVAEVDSGTPVDAAQPDPNTVDPVISDEGGLAASETTPDLWADEAGLIQPST